MTEIERSIKTLEMFLHKQCSPESTAFAYDQNEVWAAVKTATDALREKLEREGAKPLTIEELREMEGEPVWLETDDGKSKWVVVELDVYEEIYGARKNGLWLHDYGKTWVAYRHKLEEEHHDMPRRCEPDGRSLDRRDTHGAVRAVVGEMTMTELKPCPFCGEAPTAEFGIVIDDLKTDWNVIRCNNPKCRIQPMTDWHKSRAVVTREWNRRDGHD